MKLDVKKTVLLFASVHLLIAWVAERKERMTPKNTNNRPVVLGDQIVKARMPITVKYPGVIYLQP